MAYLLCMSLLWPDLGMLSTKCLSASGTRQVLTSAAYLCLLVFPCCYEIRPVLRHLEIVDLISLIVCIGVQKQISGLNIELVLGILNPRKSMTIPLYRIG